MNTFKRPTTHYGKVPEPETPYQRAAQVWDDRIGSARVQARNWRYMAFGSLILSVGFAGALVWQSARGTVVPWVVQVDNLGQAQTVAPATADYRPTDPQIAFHLGRFIEQVRSLPADPIIVRQNWLRAYDWTTDRGAVALNDYARANDPFTKVGKQQIIKITSRDPEPPSIDYVKVSGGIFLDMTIHDFDMVRYLSGAEVEEVYAEGSVTVDPEIGKAGDIDTAIITLKLDNGATAVIDNCRAACYGYDQRAEVFGTKGCVAISNDSDSNAVYSCKDGVIAEKPMFFFLERYMMAYANEVDQFIEAIVNDTPTPVNANDGLQPVLIGLAAKKSVDEHRPVKIAEIRAQYGL